MIINLTNVFVIYSILGIFGEIAGQVTGEIEEYDSSYDPLPIDYVYVSDEDLTKGHNEVRKVDIWREHRLAGEWMIMENMHSDDVPYVINHGCWCGMLNPRTNTSEVILGGPVVMDKLDQICRDWFTVRKFNDELYDGTCYRQPNGTYYKFDVIYERCHTHNRKGKKKLSQCLDDACEIDHFFANKIHDYVERKGKQIVNAECVNATLSYEPEYPIVQMYSEFLNTLEGEFFLQSLLEAGSVYIPP